MERGQQGESMKQPCTVAPGSREGKPPVQGGGNFRLWLLRRADGIFNDLSSDFSHKLPSTSQPEGTDVTAPCG